MHIQNVRTHLVGGSFLAALLLLFASVLPHTALAVDVQRVISPGGIEAWLVEDHSLPIISLALAFRGGAAADPVGKEGVSHLVSGLLDEGAGDIGSQRFQQILQDQSITLRFDAGLDSFSGSLRTLTRNRDQAFELLRLALNQPRFNSQPVERIRAQILSGLIRRQNDPNHLVGRAFWSNLFPNHPYGRPTRGTPETMTNLSANDLRLFVEQRLARDVLILGVVGDIGAAELGPLLDHVFGGLPAHAAALDMAQAEPAAAGKTIIVDHNVPQSVVVFGQRGLERDHPDFYAAYLLNHILGGGSFTSRLYQEVREERGLAYSVGTNLSPMDYANLWTGSVGTANRNVGTSIEIIRQEWAKMNSQGVSQEELDDARTHVTGRFALQLSSTNAIAGTLVSLQRQGLNIDYIDRRSDYFAAVTLEDINRIAAALLDPDSLTVAIVGRPEGVEASR